MAKKFCPQDNTAKLSFTLEKLCFFFQFYKILSKANLGKCQKCSKYFQCRICNTHSRHCGKKDQFSKDFRTDGAHVSKIYNYFYEKIA